MSICRLCLNSSKLCNSHIVPEFLYRNLYNTKRFMMGVTGKGNLGWKPLQKGVVEPLFCCECEKLFNERYEKNFLDDWGSGNPLPTILSPGQSYKLSVSSYEKFKLFHLLNFFRAGVSSLPTYEEVNLGVHEGKIREMILNGDPGKDWQYLLFGYAIYHHKTHKKIVNFIGKPQIRRFDGKVKCFSMLYGGVEWWVTLVSHRTSYLEKIALNRARNISLQAVPWNSVPVVQEAKLALK